ncbi:MAG TPA: cupredoxin family copper-binding protein [Gemmatimonadales bacterium]|nr:cupredoxin family copper-binding protein [Gemmatimonadales bacterium]
MLDRPPNLSGGWLGAPGTLQFNFVHRFGVSDPPLRKVTNSPTFLLAYQLPLPLLIGVNYATSSDIAAAFPNEWEAFARYGQRGLALQAGYNQAATSFDAELTAARSLGRIRLLAVGRMLSNGYHSDTTRYAVGGGATLRLNRWFALAGDVTTLLDRRPSEKAAWGAALQIAIPYSPHTFSLQVTNTNTATLQGESRGIDRVRGGFEFTIPFTLSRYFGKRSETASKGAAGVVTGPVTAVEMRTVSFNPKRIQIAAGTTVTWTNNDPLVHTVTADDGSWDSGPIEPGKSWSHTFTQPGEYALHCTPHPFMKAVVVVR